MRERSDSEQAAVAAAQEPTPNLHLAALGGLLGAVAASSCCILPLVLFSVGAGGVWIGQLTALAPYQPLFVAISLGFLGFGFWRVYFKPAAACAAGACGSPKSARIVKAGLWSATGLVATAIAFPILAPIFLA